MHELYPLSDAKTDANKRRLSRLLDGHTDVLVKPEWTAGRFDMFNQPACYNDFETEFRLYLSYYNMLSEAADRGYDNIPFMRVDFCRVAYLMAIAYGCKPIEMETVINAKPYILQTDDIWTVKKPEVIWEHGFYPEIIRRMREIERRLGPVGFVSSDTQSPIDVLTEIVDMEEVLCAMYDDDEPVHYLLNILTESIEEINRHQGEVVTNWIGYGHDYPITRGIHLSDDNAAFLSPNIYEVFAKPYAERLAEAFNGVTLHCCMRYVQNIEIMSKTKGLLGFDPQLAHHTEAEILPYAQGKFIRVFWPPAEGDRLAFYKKLIDDTEGICGLMIEVVGTERDDVLRMSEAVMNYAEQKGRRAPKEA